MAVIMVIVVPMAMAMTVTMIVILMLLTTLFAALLLTLVLLVALTLFRTNVTRLVFPGLHEVHLPVTRMILAAMQAPGPGVLGRNVQVQRFCHNYMRRRLLDDDRPGIDHRRRRPATEIYATVDTRRNLSLNGH
jgi:hypothetical protein